MEYDESTDSAERADENCGQDIVNTVFALKAGKHSIHEDTYYNVERALADIS
jgi:hypothetical protein